MKEQILELRSKGYSYKKIVEELGCSIGTVSYHCGEGQKEKKTIRSKLHKVANPLVYKIYKFKLDRPQAKAKVGKVGIRAKVRDFQRNRSENGSYSSGRDFNFTTEDLLKCLGDDPSCYLTGKTIDLSKPETYSLDHVIPASKGGQNILDNLGLASRKANMAKSDSSLEEFIEMCYDVLIHWEIIEKIDN